MEVKVSEKDCTSLGQSLPQVFISEILSFSRIDSLIAAGPSTGALQTYSKMWMCGTNGLISNSRYVGRYSVHDIYDLASGSQWVLQTNKQKTQIIQLFLGLAEISLKINVQL